MLRECGPGVNALVGEQLRSVLESRMLVLKLILARAIVWINITPERQFKILSSLPMHLFRHFRGKRVSGHEVELGAAQFQLGAPPADSSQAVPLFKVFTPTTFFLALRGACHS